jgi:SAM-dependent methyltransferase
MTATGRIAQRVATAMSRAERRIAPADTMFIDEAHYFSVSASALTAIVLATETVGMEPRRILDFGCGFGRVMRGLRAAFPDAELIASDVDQPGVQYCVETFGARPLASSTDLGRLPSLRDVDLVWCGSVLTHLDADQWPRLLGYFSAALADGGVAVVTTHGRRSASLIEQGFDYALAPRALEHVLQSYRARGFGYHDYDGQHGFGISLSSPAWVIEQVTRLSELRTIGYLEAGWDQHQDVLSVAKDARRVLHRPR